MVMHRGRFSFTREAQIWYSRNPDQEMLLCGFENEVVLSNEFYREILEHPNPADLKTAKALSCSPAALDLFMWLSYCCFTARKRVYGCIEKRVASDEMMADERGQCPNRGQPTSVLVASASSNHAFANRSSR